MHASKSELLAAQEVRLTVMEVSMVMLRAYERTRPKVEAFPRCSTVRMAAASAASAPSVSSLTLSHLAWAAQPAHTSCRMSLREHIAGMHSTTSQAK